MILFIIIITLFIVINLLYFILPSLSPIPFFPTNKKDLPMIIKSMLDNQYQVSSIEYQEKRKKILNTKYLIQNTIIDLGAGTGTVLFAAATEALKKNLSTTFIAIEIHPLLIAVMHIKRALHPNKKNIHIVRGDIFSLDYKVLLSSYSQNTKYLILNTIYLYVGPFVMERLKKKLAEFPKNTRVVSYMYTIPGWEKRLIDEKKGVHSLFSYIIDNKYK